MNRHRYALLCSTSPLAYAGSLVAPPEEKVSPLAAPRHSKGGRK